MYGPIFGSSCGHDMRIYDENCNSYVNFPSTFNRTRDNKLTEDLNQRYQAYNQFAGDTFFKVIEYEVF